MERCIARENLDSGEIEEAGGGGGWRAHRVGGWYSPFVLTVQKESVKGRLSPPVVMQGFEWLLFNMESISD